MTKKIAITGGTGFLGCHLARRLLKEGYHVTLIDIAPLEAEDLITKVAVIKADIQNKQQITKALAHHDYVVHAAAALPIQYDKHIIEQVNIVGTKHVLEASLTHKVKRLIFISSTATYGVPRHLPETEDSPLDPIGHYGKSKIAGENLCFAYAKKGLTMNIIRPKTFLGPERLGIFQLWFEAIYTNKPVFILGKGNNLYQLLAVSDVCEAILKALTSTTKNTIFNIGAKKFGTWREDLGAVIAFAKSKSKIVSFPVLPSQLVLSILEKLHLSPIAAWHYKTIPVDSYVSITKAEQKLDWHPKKSNAQLLIASYQWYASHRNDILQRVGNTHRVRWNFKILDILKFLPF